ncbi:hypothetical protein LJR129_005028 [Acidovorax sp. LjRoot129]|uniref:hypothetical protein n=1 Tax=unclassified Acidovorax TaxID=2684926 RepID=UPI003ED0F255
MDKFLFFLALVGSIGYVFDRGLKLMGFISEKMRGTPAAAPKPKNETGSKQEPSLESAKKVDDQTKQLIDLLSTQNEEIQKLSKVVADMSARLTAVESSKPRATRKVPAAKPPAVPVDLPSTPGMGFEGLPPVSGGFEPVH